MPAVAVLPVEVLPRALLEVVVLPFTAQPYVALEVVPAAKPLRTVLEVVVLLVVALPPAVVPLSALLEVAVLPAVAAPPLVSPEVAELAAEVLLLHVALAAAMLPVQARLQGSAGVTSFL